MRYAIGSVSEFDQAAIAYLETTNPDAATCMRNAITDIQSMSLADIACEKEVEPDPDDGAAVETGGTSIDAWVTDIDYDPETTDMAGTESEGDR